MNTQDEIRRQLLETIDALPEEGQAEVVTLLEFLKYRHDVPELPPSTEDVPVEDFERIDAIFREKNEQILSRMTDVLREFHIDDYFVDSIILSREPPLFGAPGRFCCRRRPFCCGRRCCKPRNQ